ncbi:GNAT family N-acetyltransferase [Nocardioides sp. Y6]|uniref:GNAT family N-acetyltransferase n=1 Tax=Nocardioides malaquae TaxID=2773426 RepID=A0ABR9RRE4_9ACTN|nr:GNAT family N-acetyltransferase [Nocardioides malaquae]MBE7324143.1 GNAT family N-acetyltransferase [Nocardioides malaquae]
MTPDLRVRRAGADDVDEVATLLHAFNVEFETPTPSVAEFARRLSTQVPREDVRVWLAEKTGAGTSETLGFSLVTLRPSPYYDVGVATLEELYVRPHRRGAGAGTALLGALLAWAEEEQVGEIQINVDEVDVDARRFYERHGFSHLEPTGDGETRMFLYLREMGGGSAPVRQDR